MKLKCKPISKRKLIPLIALAFGMMISIPSISIISRGNRKINNHIINENHEQNVSSIVSKKNSSPIDINNASISDMAYLLMDSNEHYYYSDLFIKEYQQASGGYIAFAKKTGHLVDKSNCEPNQKWHFFESWMYQSFKDGSLTWEAEAKSRVYTKLLCPELLLWIYEACGVNSTLVSNAYDVAVQGKIAGTTTTTIAKNMRGVVAWEDLVAGLSAKTPTYRDAPTEQINEEPNSGITVGDFANFLIDKNEKYSLTSEFIKNHQAANEEYLDFAVQTGHSISKNNGEPNQKWHFFEYWLLDSMKNGYFDWDSDAKTNIYSNIESLELLLWIFESSGVSSAKLASAKTVAENGRNTLEDPAVTASKMRECVSWNELSAMISDQRTATSVTLSPNPLKLVVGNDAKVTATVEPSNTTDIPTWSIIDGSDYINIIPNGNSVTVHGVTAGIAEIEISYSENVSDICVVTISEPEIMINDLPDEIVLDIGESLTLQPKLNIGSGTFTFYSSANDIASVTTAGVVNGLVYGSAVITVECIENPELTRNIDVTVRKLSESAETLYSTCLFGRDYNSKGVNNYTSEFSSSNNDFTWNLQYFSNNNNNWDFIRTGNAAAASVATITTSDSYSVPISKVVLVIDSIRSQDVNSISLLYGSSVDNLSNSIPIDSLSAGEHTFVIPNPTINQYYRLAFDCKIYTTGTSRIAQVSKIEFYKKDIAPSSNKLEDLIALMNETNTCEDFADASYLRELYNALSPEEQEVFDNTICTENSECTMAEKLAYMEELTAIANSKTFGSNKLVTLTNDFTNLIFIAVIGFFALFTYYYYNKKKYLQK